MEKIQLQRVLPNEIEQRSFEIITQELRERGEQDKILPENELVVKRVIHTTADFDYADNLCFSENAVDAALELLKNGAVYDTVKLSEENSWRYGWTDLPAMENGQPVDWQVTELTPEGYTVTVSREGETFLVTNTGHGPQNPGEPTLPQTGSLWWPVPPPKPAPW